MHHARGHSYFNMFSHNWLFLPIGFVCDRPPCMAMILPKEKNLYTELLGTFQGLLLKYDMLGSNPRVSSKMTYMTQHTAGMTRFLWSRTKSRRLWSDWVIHLHLGYLPWTNYFWIIVWTKSCEGQLVMHKQPDLLNNTPPLRSMQFNWSMRKYHAQ